MRILLLSLLVLSLVFPASALAAAPRVLFDQGHGQAFRIEKQGELQLGKLADQFRRDGWQVIATEDALTPQMLDEVDALVISGAFRPLTEHELMAIGGFLMGGGRLAVMLHIAPPMVPLLGKLGVDVANGVVHEGDPTRVIDGEAINFKIDTLQSHALTEGLSHISVYGSWPLNPRNQYVHILASTSPKAWVDLDRDQLQTDRDATQAFGLLVSGAIGSGEFAVFGDDAIFQNRYLDKENTGLAENLSRWMMQGRLPEGQIY